MWKNEGFAWETATNIKGVRKLKEGPEQFQDSFKLIQQITSVHVLSELTNAWLLYFSYRLRKEHNHFTHPLAVQEEIQPQPTG